MGGFSFSTTAARAGATPAAAPGETPPWLKPDSASAARKSDAGKLILFNHMNNLFLTTFLPARMTPLLQAEKNAKPQRPPRKSKGERSSHRKPEYHPSWALSKYQVRTVQSLWLYV
jgi:hypothetical protein